MATVVLTVVGTAIGGPIGGAIGGFLGRKLDQAILGGGGARTVEGGRLSDLSVQVSSYGEPINRVYGAMRLPGNVVWSSGLTERRQEKTSGSGGKGGGQKVTTVTYSYSASFAVALSGREISGVGRIWADGKLLGDATGRLAVGGEMRLYTGSAFQLGDPLIEALEGQDNVNALRSMAYVVFEDLELAEYANRIPNLTFEVIADPGGQIALSEVVADVCALSGLPAWDSSDLDQMVSGYVISGPVTARAVIEQLAEVYHFDVVEQDDGLLFRKLDRPLTRTVAAADLVVSAAGGRRADKISLNRLQDMDLPREIGLSYIDPARDYQTGHQRARRGKGASDRVRQKAYPLVLSADQAKAISEVQLDLAWGGREQAGFILPPRYADLAPGDIVDLGGGAAANSYLLQEIEASPEGLSCQAVKFSPGLFGRTATADSGPVPGQQVAAIADSRFLPLDMPTITGAEVSAPILFWAVAAGSGKWTGATLFLSRDGGQSYDALDSLSAKAISGTVENILSSGPTAYWDQANEVQVRLDNPADSLAGATREAVLNGANIAWLGGEIIQFQQAVLQPDGSYLLSGLLRGRRGTEHAVATHGAAEDFILLTEAAVQAATLNYGDIGRTYAYKCVTTGGRLEDVAADNFLYQARALKPFAPVHARGSRDGSGNLTLRWIRRSRVGGEWNDYADAPLGELYEKYDIEILDGAAVVRTLTSDQPQVAYPAALQAEDFGAPQSAVTVRISQLSDRVGRGWPLTVSL